MFDAFRRAFLYFFDRGEELVNRATKRQLECDTDEDVISPKFRKIGSPRFHHTPLTSLDFLVPAEVRMKRASRTLQNELSLIRGRGAEMSARKASKENISSQDDDDECIVVSDEENDWVPASPIPKAISRLKLKQKPVQGISSDANNSSADVKKDDDIEVLKTVKSKNDCPLHFSTPREGLSIINKRFFPSVRREASIQFRQHPVKMKESRNSKPKKRSALDESIRLDEKMQYSQLLKQQCSSSPYFFGSCAESSPRKTASDKMKNEGLSKSKSVVDIIDLTEDGTEGEKTSKDRDTDAKKLGNEDLEIIEEKTSQSKKESYGKVFNPFKSQLFCTNWISAESELFDYVAKERERRAEEERIKAELYRKRNKQLYADILEERIRNHMKITEAILEDEVIVEEEEEEAALPKLTPEIERRVASALRPEPQSEVLVEAFSLKITRHDICTLAGTNWLNDEVINFYMNLLIERGKKNKYQPVYAFNTFFYPRLQSSGYSAVKRWTRKVDVFANDIIIIPVHLGVHWCMAAINFKKKMICYYDSMGGNNDVCLQLLWNYLGSEKMDKKQQKFDYDGWKTENVKRIPQQMNGSDCGVFSCTYAEFICRNAAFRFSQKDMPYFRRKMVYEILSKELMM
ncbi:sentrin-specific protease 1-like isoform X1 [Schistocerca piceifrons]|uniref:sentrin-specific protease 1-like isoform X1 n=1 Tax=Schistocerca piceifrons TaxID=274613 RepID=UPI001F5E949F|nr:sentrin-specific protease 1-like isoform X1 [Schistocerca piceifrons]